MNNEKQRNRVKLNVVVLSWLEMSERQKWRIPFKSSCVSE